MNDAVVVIMAKQPQVGRTKTRLCPPLTPAEAAAAAEALLFDTLALAAESGCDLAVAITPAGARPYFTEHSPPGTRLLNVEGADIGACLDQALSDLFTAGYAKAIALNADGPSLPPEILPQAAQALDSHNVVLGPTDDGGYYLIGLKQPQPGLFSEIAWSTQTVFSQTLARAAALGLQVAQLPAWYDVDSAQDLLRLQTELAHLPAGRLQHVRRLLAGLNLPTRLARTAPNGS